MHPETLTNIHLGASAPPHTPVTHLWLITMSATGSMPFSLIAATSSCRSCLLPYLLFRLYSWPAAFNCSSKSSRSSGGSIVGGPAVNCIHWRQLRGCWAIRCCWNYCWCCCSGEHPACRRLQQPIVTAAALHVKVLNKTCCSAVLVQAIYTQQCDCCCNVIHTYPAQQLPCCRTWHVSLQLRCCSKAARWHTMLGCFVGELSMLRFCTAGASELQLARTCCRCVCCCVTHEMPLRAAQQQGIAA